MRRLHFAVVPFLLLVATSCTRRTESSTLREPTIDTLPGGAIHVVNHGPSEWPDSSGWRLVLERRIPSPADGPGLFAFPRNIVATAAGEIVLLDRRPASIKVYSAEGEFLHTIGREGAGPGEYADFGDLAIVGDTLIVNDRSHGRFTLFLTDGTLLRTFAGGRGAMRGQATSDGRIALEEYLAHPPSTPEDNYAGRGIRHYHTDGTVTDSLFYPPEPLGRLWALKDATHDLGAFIPFSPERVRAFTPDGALLWGDQHRYHIIRPTTGMDSALVIEANAPAIPISDSLRQAELADVIKYSPWAEGIAKLDEIPTTYPVWTDLRTDGDGNIWVLRPGPRGPGDVFDVFTAIGRLRGSVPAPFATLEYAYWTATHIYRIGTTESGEPAIEVWRIVKS